MAKRDLDKQEELVKALWAFAHAQQTNPHNCSQDGGASVHLGSVGTTLETIMRIFGYEVTEIV